MKLGIDAGGCGRDEQVQADYMREVLSILDEEQVERAFWYTFASYGYPNSADSRHDLDCASYSVVKMLDGATGVAYPDMPWEPKQPFYALADYYGRAD